MRNLLIILYCPLWFGFQVSAQQTDTLKTKQDGNQWGHNLEEVTVTGIRIDQLSAKNAVNLTQKDIASVGSENFINVVDQLPGIVKVQETTFPLLIRGMYGSRIHVEKNGIVKTGIDQSGYSLEDINPDEVSDVQLLHGARSIAYGSGSMGGVLLINEKLAFKEKGISGNAKIAYATNNNERTANTKLRYANTRNILSLSGRYTLADNFYYPEKQEAINSSYTYKNLSASYAYRFTNRTLVEWENNFYSGTREKPVGFQNNPYDYRTFFDKYNIESSLRFKTGIGNGINLCTNFWYNGLNTNQQQDSYNAGTLLLTYRETRYSYKNAGGVKLTAAKKINRYWTTQTGADWFIDGLTQDIRYQDFKHNTNNLYPDYSKQQQNIGGIYAIAEYEKKKTSVGFSLRADMGSLEKDTVHSSTYYFLSGGLDWGWKIKPWLENNLSLSQHFRFPIPMEAVGVFYGGRGTFVGNPSIEPETSYNIEWLVKGSLSHFYYSANLWTSLFFNRISEVLIFTNKYTYQNINKARLCGFDGSATAFIGNKKTWGRTEFTVNASYSIGDDVSQKGFLSYGEPLEGIPPGRVRSKLEYFKSWKAVEPSVFVVFTHMSAYNRLPDYAIKSTWGQNERPAYSLWDAGFNISIPRLLNGTSLSLLINNVLDKSYQPYGSYLQGIGRNVKLTLNVKF